MTESSGYSTEKLKMKMEKDKFDKHNLIEDLQPLVGGQREYAERAAHYILARDKKNGAPLVKAMKTDRSESAYHEREILQEAIDQTLKNLGLGASDA